MTFDLSKLRNSDLDALVEKLVFGFDVRVGPRMSCGGYYCLTFYRKEFDEVKPWSSDPILACHLAERLRRQGKRIMPTSPRDLACFAIDDALRKGESDV